jgi:hypothetical protein
MSGWVSSGFSDDQRMKGKPRVLKIIDLENIPENSSQISLHFLFKFD